MNSFLMQYCGPAAAGEKPYSEQAALNGFCGPRETFDQVP